MFQPVEETRDRDALVALQLERLRDTLAHIAANNPAYLRHLGWVAARDIASLADLRQRPVVAVSVPAGLSSDGLPIGLQILGKHFDEVAILRVAHAYQGVTDWHRQVPAIGAVG